MYDQGTGYIQPGIKIGFMEEELFKLNIEGKGFGGKCVSDRGNSRSKGIDFRKQGQHKPKEK